MRQLVDRRSLELQSQVSYLDRDPDVSRRGRVTPRHSMPVAKNHHYQPTSASSQTWAYDVTGPPGRPALVVEPPAVGLDDVYDAKDRSSSIAWRPQRSSGRRGWTISGVRKTMRPTPDRAPSVRSRPHQWSALVYSHHQSTILIGGIKADGSLLNDTWAYDSRTIGGQSPSGESAAPPACCTTWRSSPRPIAS